MLPLRTVSASVSDVPVLLTPPSTNQVGATLNAIADDVATVPPFKHRFTVDVKPVPGYANEYAPLVLAPLVIELAVETLCAAPESATFNAPAALTCCKCRCFVDRSSVEITLRTVEAIPHTPPCQSTKNVPVVPPVNQLEKLVLVISARSGFRVTATDVVGTNEEAPVPASTCGREKFTDPDVVITHPIPHLKFIVPLPVQFAVVSSLPTVATAPAKTVTPLFLYVAVPKVAVPAFISKISWFVNPPLTDSTYIDAVYVVPLAKVIAVLDSIGRALVAVCAQARAVSKFPRVDDAAAALVPPPKGYVQYVGEVVPPAKLDPSKRHAADPSISKPFAASVVKS